MPVKGAVMVVDDDQAFRESLVDNILIWEYKVISATGGREALEKIGKLPVEVVLMDIRMPEMNGIDCLARIHQLYPGVKVIMMTAYSEQMQRALEIGAMEVLSKPLDMNKLFELLKKTAIKPMVLVVDDDPVFSQDLGLWLQEAGFAASFARNGSEALQLVRGCPPDIVILDMVLPDKNGINVLDEMRREVPALPVFLVTVHSEISSLIRQAVEDKATAFFTKPLLIEDFLKHLKGACHYN